MTDLDALLVDLAAARGLEAFALAEVIAEHLATASRKVEVARRQAVALLADTEGTRETARILGLSPARVSQLAAKAREDVRDVWALTPDGAPRARWAPADELAQAREAVQLAKVAQEQRAEAYGLGYRTETAAFYGSDKVAASDVAETRVIFTRKGYAGQQVQREIVAEELRRVRSEAIRRGLARKAARNT